VVEYGGVEEEDEEDEEEDEGRTRRRTRRREGPVLIYLCLQPQFACHSMIC
jgi:hypothetical protein